MRITMLADRPFMDAGQERILRRGQSYDLPTVVGESLIATAAAKHEETAPADGGKAAPGPTDTKPQPPLETGHGRNRR